MIDIAVEAQLDNLTLCMCTAQHVIVDVKIKGKFSMSCEITIFLMYLFLECMSGQDITHCRLMNIEHLLFI